MMEITNNKSMASKTKEHNQSDKKEDNKKGDDEKEDSKS